MRKISMLLLISMFCITSKAQLKIIDPSTNSEINSNYYVPILKDSSTHSFDFEIHNNYTSSKTIKIKRYLIEYTAGHDVYYCFGTNCYSASTNPLFNPPQEVTISSGGTLPNGAGTFGLKTDFDNNGFNGSSTVRYTLYDVNNISDSISFTIQYVVSPVGIEKHSTSNYELSNGIPNPASAKILIPYDLKENNHSAKISLYNMIGNKLKEIKLTERKGTCELDLSVLPGGVYFYSLSIENQLISTKKLVIER